MRRSIRARLLTWILLLIVPLSAATGVLLAAVFANRMLRDVDVALQEEADTLATLVRESVSPAELAPVLERLAGERDLGPGKQVAVLRDGHLLAESPAGAYGRMVPPEPGLRIVRVEGDREPTALTILIGVRATPALRAGQQLEVLLGIGIPSLLVLLAVGLWVVISRALRPLEEAARQVGEITGANLAARVQVPSTDDEVGRMVAVLNAMLDRLEFSVLELQRFTADAAHELRTPLAVLRTGLEVSLSRDRTAAEYRATLEEALSGIEHLARLTGDLLTLARLDANAPPRATVSLSLSEMLHELVDAWLPLAQQRGVELSVEASDRIVVEGNEGDLYRLLSNLVGNALSHSPDGGRVTLAATRESPWACVSIADAGPGLAPGEEERIFGRFYRGTGVRAGEGSGLGLSIARNIAVAHGGDLSIGNREPRGCIARARLPLAN